MGHLNYLTQLDSCNNEQPVALQSRRTVTGSLVTVIMLLILQKTSMIC